MQKLLLDCIEGIYIAKYGHLTLILTQDLDTAKRIGRLYTGNEVHPQWWIEQMRITQRNYPNIVQSLVVLENHIGSMGIREFCNLFGDFFAISGFSI